jgi:hypothetical protein
MLVNWNGGEEFCLLLFPQFRSESVRSEVEGHRGPPGWITSVEHAGHGISFEALVLGSTHRSHRSQVRFFVGAQGLMANPGVGRCFDLF